jgi:hypothetical protein
MPSKTKWGRRLSSLPVDGIADGIGVEKKNPLIPLVNRDLKG